MVCVPGAAQHVNVALLTRDPGSQKEKKAGSRISSAPLRSALALHRIRDTRSIIQTAAVIPRLARHRITDDEIVAGNMREAAEVHDIVELVVTGRKSLVAAGGDGECIAHGNRLRHRLP